MCSSTRTRTWSLLPSGASICTDETSSGYLVKVRSRIDGLLPSLKLVGNLVAWNTNYSSAIWRNGGKLWETGIAIVRPIASRLHPFSPRPPFPQKGRGVILNVKSHLLPQRVMLLLITPSWLYVSLTGCELLFNSEPSIIALYIMAPIFRTP